MKKVSWLKQTLILSIALNGVLFGLIFYFLVRENPLHLSYKPTTPIDTEFTPLAPSLLDRLHALSYDHLVELLSDQRPVEQGYRVCDFAAGALVTFYDFDLARALNKVDYPGRSWDMDEMPFVLFPGLTDEDFESLIYFAQTESYPFTPKGLLEKIERDEHNRELLTTFCHTPPFILLETLFARTKLPITKGTLLTLVREGGWEPLELFHRQQQATCDLSDLARRQLLLSYIDAGAKTAAYLMLITDFDHAIAHLPDEKIASILDLIDTQTQESLKFAQTLATSPRNDPIRAKAYSLLTSYGGEEIAGRYVPRPGVGELRPAFRQAPPAAPDPRTHIIQPGESLWLIARKYDLSIERLMEANNLSSTTIRPGKVLNIPLEP